MVLSLTCLFINQKYGKDKTPKGNYINLSTFLGWKEDVVIVYKTKEVEGKKIVNFIWCKVCAHYKEALL